MVESHSSPEIRVARMYIFDVESVGVSYVEFTGCLMSSVLGV